jgi:hypothetical protein
MMPSHTGAAPKEERNDGRIAVAVSWGSGRQTRILPNYKYNYKDPQAEETNEQI